MQRSLTESLCATVAYCFSEKVSIVILSWLTAQFIPLSLSAVAMCSLNNTTAPLLRDWKQQDGTYKEPAPVLYVDSAQAKMNVWPRCLCLPTQGHAAERSVTVCCHLWGDGRRTGGAIQNSRRCLFVWRQENVHKNISKSMIGKLKYIRMGHGQQVFKDCWSYIVMCYTFKLQKVMGKYVKDSFHWSGQPNKQILQPFFFCWKCCDPLCNRPQ